MDKQLHIISLDVPLPANYGGAIDIFQRIKALSESGMHIHLHCFYRDRPKNPELNQYCKSVNYYPRKTGLAGIKAGIPYIVHSRRSDEMIKRLKLDDYPILIEGVHCSGFLQDSAFKNRKVLVRLHNVEFAYYRALARLEKNLSKKLYFLRESRLLLKYENALAAKWPLAAISGHDEAVYRNHLHARNIHLLPAFLPWQQVTIQPGKGAYCLYHGNLGIIENEAAVIWLMEEIFTGDEILIIAGNQPSAQLKNLIATKPNVELRAQPTDDELHELIARAQINLVPSLNTTGIKLKLLHALFAGRHCLVNKAGVDVSGLETLCTLAETTEEWRTQINKLMNIAVDDKEAAKRQRSLMLTYNNAENAKRLSSWL